MKTKVLKSIQAQENAPEWLDHVFGAYRTATSLAAAKGFPPNEYELAFIERCRRAALQQKMNKKVKWADLAESTRATRQSRQKCDGGCRNWD